MAGTQAAPLPPLDPGEFRFITNALTSDGPSDGPRRFRAVASSTITDLAGNTISPKALFEMRDDFRSGRTIFMDHDYTNVVDKVFGTSDSAEVVETAARDERTGAPIYDLIISGPVNEPNPKAVQLHDSIKGGYVKFGTSIGAIVRKHTRDKETGGMLIDSLSAKEASIVGIPKNQRSWAYKASAAVADMPDDEALADDPEEETETQVVAASGEVLQQWVVDPKTTTADTITLSSTAPILVETLDTESGAPLVRQDLCTCGQGEDSDEHEESCGKHIHDSLSAEDLSASESVTTPGGQEAPVATPETAPATGEAPDPAIEQQAAFEVEDVAALVAHAKALVEEIGSLRAENARLSGEITTLKAGYTRLSSVEQDATEAIRKVMALPLRRKAVGHVEDFTARYPGLDPRVSSYIERATKEPE